MGLSCFIKYNCKTFVKFVANSQYFYHTTFTCHNNHRHMNIFFVFSKNKKLQDGWSKVHIYFSIFSTAESVWARYNRLLHIPHTNMLHSEKLKSTRISLKTELTQCFFFSSKRQFWRWKISVVCKCCQASIWWAAAPRGQFFEQLLSWLILSLFVWDNQPHTPCLCCKLQSHRSHAFCFGSLKQN